MPTSSGLATMTASVLELDNCLQGQQNDFLYPEEKAGQAGDGARKKKSLNTDKVERSRRERPSAAQS